MGMMLAAEPAEPGVMGRPPRRPGKRLLGKLVLWRCLFVSTLMWGIVLACYYWSITRGLPLSQRRAEVRAGWADDKVQVQVSKCCFLESVAKAEMRA